MSEMISDFAGLALSPKGHPLSPSLRLRRIGAGFDGNVYRAHDSETGEIYAIKQPSSPRARRASMSPEGRKLANSLEGLDHENVLRHRHGFENGDMVMEYVEGGSMVDFIERQGGKLREDQTAKLMEQVLSGLVYLHSKGVVHKDIKPANLLLTEEGKVKISDIAGAPEERPGGLKVPVGTPVFLAPEVVRTGAHEAASDIWSVGCSALQCLTGKLPWDEEDNAFSAMFKVGHGKAPQLPNDLTTSCRHFLEDCFSPDPAERPSAEDLLEHPFLEHHKVRSVRPSRWGNAPPSKYDHRASDYVLTPIPSGGSSQNGSWRDSRTSSIASQSIDPPQEGSWRESRTSSIAELGKEPAHINSWRESWTAHLACSSQSKEPAELDTWRESRTSSIASQTNTERVSSSEKSNPPTGLGFSVHSGSFKSVGSWPPTP
mmetsp:Transcript_45355/g.106446  ORF Transcript_45355/g.106446 Transcript_45355/m.106446 type:complete len:431 (-) Transcript_45355:283-1575(-)